MAKKIDVSARSLNDTRGLPATMDPRKFYEYSSQRRQEQATGLEGLLYRLLPKNFIGSFAYAIDPYSKFRMALGKVSPVVRTRSKKVKSITDTRMRSYHRNSRTWDHRQPQPSWFTENSTVALTVQDPIEQLSKDTTRRLRVVGSDIGEFSKWKTTLVSPSRVVVKTYSDHEWYTATPNGYAYESIQSEKYTWSGPAARITQATVTALYNAEVARATALLQKYALGMYKGILPERRTYTLLRNIVELRDIPRSILQLQATLKAFSKLYDSEKIPSRVRFLTTNRNAALKQIPKEWLSYSFGWRQTYSDMMGLLLSPAKIGKKIDFLIRRNGKATTYRSKREISTSDPASSAFTYDSAPVEFSSTVSHLNLRKTELRMVVNATLEFPPSDLPNLRKKEFLRQLGVSPTFTDMYNLIPWTWLIDWFSGLGDYVEVIDNINSDRNLVNWGLFTASVQGTLRTDYTSKVTSHHYAGINGSGSDSPSTVVNHHRSELLYNLQLRKDLASLSSVNVATDIGSLSLYQQSILGSLLFTRNQKFRG